MVEKQIESQNWYMRDTAQVLEALGTVAAQGLGAEEARQRLIESGPNELVERGGRTRGQILVEQLTGVLTLILFAAAIISVFLGEYIDAGVILAIIVLNAALGFSQEYRAEQSMAALKRMAVPSVRVRRDGRLQEVSARDLVPGDIVTLEAGNVVPADGRVLVSVNLRAQEAALTGESEPVEKEAGLVFESEKALGDRRNMLYMGTVVNYGRGEMVVTETGMNTELGHIAEMIQSVEQELTPLQRRLDQLGKFLAVAAILIVIVVFLVGILQGQDFETMLLASVSLAVAAIPEAMTAVVTIALSLGAQRMLKRRALIRKLPAVETLGSVSVICSDKTGTLTLNKMTVTVLDIANHRIDLQQRPGESDLEVIAREGETPTAELLPTLDLLLVSGALCNDATLVENEAERDRFKAVGDPTEGALVLAAAQAGILKSALDPTFPRLGELPFDSVRKRMTTVHATPQAREEIPPSLVPVWERKIFEGAPPPYLVVTKGAIDSLLDVASQVFVEGRTEPLDEGWRSRIMEANNELAGKGMRVLGVGLRAGEALPEKLTVDNVESDLTLVGLFGMIDPPRPEVMDAVQTCRTAGIRPVMITGDHPLTARHIAQQIGITTEDRFLTGQELDELSLEDLRRVAKDTSVFARVSPEHKLKLIQAYQDQAYIVAMTGDGVNDAPALKKADIGVAMGITGTDVAKESSDMVLLDDNFATIVAAVEEGRIIYDNIRKFIKYLLSCNASEIGVMLLGPFFGLPLPLLPLQILWMNLVTDGLPALALGVEPAEERIMKRPPYSSTESVFGRGAVPFIIGMGIVMSVLALAVGIYSFRSGTPHWQTLLFTTLIFAQLALALGVRSEENSLFKIGLLSNRSMLGAILMTVLLQMAVVYIPVFQRIFRTAPLSWQELAVALGVSVAVWLVTEVVKVFLRRRRSS